MIGYNAYFTYDSFGVLAYAMADLVLPAPDGVDPTELFKKDTDGMGNYEYRPEICRRFKLQWGPGYKEMSGGAVKMADTEAGYCDTGNLQLAEEVNTAAECVDVEIATGRFYVGDHGAV